MNKSMKEVLVAAAVEKAQVTIRFARGSSTTGLIEFVGDDYLALNVGGDYLLIPHRKVDSVLVPVPDRYIG